MTIDLFKITYTSWVKITNRVIIPFTQYIYLKHLGDPFNISHSHHSEGVGLDGHCVCFDYEGRAGGYVGLCYCLGVGISNYHLKVNDNQRK